MWRRCLAAKSRQVAHNFGATINHPNKVPVSQSHTLLFLSSPSPSQIESQFCSPFYSESSPPYQNLIRRFLSHTSVANPTQNDNDNENETEDHSSLGGSSSQIDEDEAEADITPPWESHQLSHSLSGNGDSLIGNFTSETESGELSWGSVEEEEDDLHIAKEEVYEIDKDKLENVLSLLLSSTDGSLESSLDSIGVDLHEEFIVQVLQTPLVLGENVIKFFKWAIRKPEISVTTRLVDVLVQAICSGLRKKDAYALWDLVREIADKDNLLLNAEILNRLIALFSKLGKGKAALEVFNKFGDFGCVPDSDSYYYTIEALCRRSCFDWASSVCEKMLNAETLPDGDKVGKIICWFCKGSRAKEAHMVYMLAKEKNKHPPQSAVSFLISVLSQKDETVKLGLEMLEAFSGETRKYAIKSFSSVIRSLCRIKDLDRAKLLLSKMIDEGPPPGNAVFNSIINGYSKSGDMKEAVEMKKSMERRGLKPDLFTYTVIMSGYASGGQMEEACKILSEVKKKHSKLSPVTYHTLIRGYCKLERFDKALELLTEMKEFGVQPNVDEYNKLIQSLCLKALDWEMAERLLEKMKEDGLHLNGITQGLIRAVKELEEEGLEKEVSIDA